MSKENPIVLVDMDGVLADFDKATDEYLRNHPENIPLLAREHFYYHHNYSDQRHIELITTLHVSENFFRNLPLIPRALKGWQRIIDLGYTPRICSSPLHTNQWCKDEKIAWLEEHLGKEVAENAIIDRRKYAYDGIALIDDRPELEGNEQASWQHVVFDASYNQDSPAKLRLHGWDDPALGDILAKCHELHTRNR